MAEMNDGVFKENLGYDVTKLGLQANREMHQTVDEKTDREIYDKDATGISLGEAVTIEAGGEIGLEITQTKSIDNVPSVVWESSDTTVAYVTSEGIVRGVKPGTVTITATAIDSDIKPGSVFATVQITVIDANSPKITVLVNDEAMGTVSGGGYYTAGDKATLVATANDGYKFVKWDDEDTNATREITVVAAGGTYTAIFEENPPVQKFTLSVVSNNDEYGTTTGSGEYEAGVEVEIKAIPNEGYIFSKWNDDDTNAVRTVTVEGDATYTATFVVAE